MKTHFEKLFAYEQWANQKVLDALMDAEPLSDRALEIFSHLLSTRHLWLCRIRSIAPSAAVWERRTLELCAIDNKRYNEDWKDYFVGLTLAELGREVHYVNTLGQEYSSTVQDILTHVFNHSTYHRGQVVSYLKQYSDKLPITDYIAFARD